MSKQNNGEKKGPSIQAYINKSINEECQKWPDGNKSKTEMLVFLLNLAEKNVFPLTRESHKDYITQMTKREGNAAISTLKPTSGYIWLKNKSVKSALKAKGFDKIPVEMVNDLYIELDKRKNPAYLAHKQSEWLREATEKVFRLLKEFQKLNLIEQRAWINEFNRLIKEQPRAWVNEFNRFTKEQQRVLIDAYEYQSELTKKSIEMDIETFKNILRVVQEKSKKITGPKSFKGKFIIPNSAVVMMLAAFMAVATLFQNEGTQSINDAQKTAATTEIEVNPETAITTKRGAIGVLNLGEKSFTDLRKKNVADEILTNNEIKNDLQIQEKIAKALTWPEKVENQTTSESEIEREIAEVREQAKAEEALAIFLSQIEAEKKHQKIVDHMIEESKIYTLDELLEENQANYINSVFVNMDNYMSASAQMDELQKQGSGCVFIRVRKNNLFWQPSTIARECHERGLYFQFVLLSRCTDETQAKAEADMLKAEIDKIKEAGYDDKFLGSTIFLGYDAINPEKDPQVGKDCTPAKEKLFETIGKENGNLYLFTQSVYDSGSLIGREKGIVDVEQLLQYFDGALVLADNIDPEFEKKCIENGLPIVGKFNRNWKDIEINKALVDYCNNELKEYSEEEKEFLTLLFENELRDKWEKQRQKKLDEIKAEYDERTKTAEKAILQKRSAQSTNNRTLVSEGR